MHEQLTSILGGADPALAAKVVFEQHNDGVVATDTYINAQNAGIDVDALIEIAEVVYELTAFKEHYEQEDSDT